MVAVLMAGVGVGAVAEEGGFSRLIKGKLPIN